MIGGDEFQGMVFTDEDDFPFVFEGHCYAVADHRLDLAEAPVGTVAVAHQGAHLKERMCHGRKARPMTDPTHLHPGVPGVAVTSGAFTPGDDLMAEQRLSGLIVARLCHDLVGPVGAVSNGIDLLRETSSAGVISDEDLALVTQSNQRSADLLRLLRLAFGTASGDEHGIERAALVDDLATVLGTRRLHLAAIGREGPNLPAGAARITALMALAGKLTAGVAGTMELVFSPDAALPVRLSVIGEKARLTPEMQAWLSGSLSPFPTSREVELAVLPRVVAAAGGRIEASDDGAGSVVIVVQ